jgi:hypothetical protein
MNPPLMAKKPVGLPKNCGSVARWKNGFRASVFEAVDE